MGSRRRTFGRGATTAAAVLVAMLASPAVAGAVVPPSRTPPPQIVQYPLPTPPIHPFDLTHGPDGALWFTELNTARIARFTDSGSLREFPVSDPDQFLRGITDGPDGALWFAEEGKCKNDRCSDFTDGKIGRITTQGRITEFPVPSTNGHPWEITHGPDGNVWFTEIGDNLHAPGHGHKIEGNKIGRITPQGQVTEFPVPTFDSFPNHITTGPDGALWFTENTGNKIGRITTSGAITEFPIPTPNSRSIGITAGLDGNLWFTEQIGQRIGRITPQGLVTEFPLPNAGNPVDITVGPDGAQWFTEVVGQRIGRIATDGSITEYPLPPGSFPLPIAIGPGFRDVWFAEVGTNSLGRIPVCETAQFLRDCVKTALILSNPNYLARP